MKKTILVITFFLITSYIYLMQVFAVEHEIYIMVNGEELSADVVPVISEGRILIPFRAVFEAMDATVIWNSEKKHAVGFKDEICIELPLNKKEAYISGTRIVLDTATTSYNGRILIPLRFAAEALGAEVDWYQEKKLVVISTKDAYLKDITEKSGYVFNSSSGIKLSLGMDLSELIFFMDTPDSVYPDERGFSWYLYNTDIGDTIHVGVDNESVVAFSTNSLNWRYMQDVVIGQAVPSFYIASQEESLNLFYDGSGKVSAYSLFVKEVIQRKRIYDPSIIAGMERRMFDYANTARVIYDLKEMQWCERAAQAAKKHSIDMGLRSYFSHSTPEGASPWDRMKAEGIDYSYAGENLSYATFYSFDILNIHNRWMNSSGHRGNILNGNFQYLGVGIVNSGYMDKYIYSTQNFYSLR